MKFWSGKIWAAIWPYLLIGVGWLLLLITPVSFYADNNLDLFRLTEPSALGVNQTSLPAGGDLPLLSLSGSRPLAPVARRGNYYQGELSAAAVYAIDEQSQNVLFDQEGKQTRALASVTKLMSTIILLDFSVDWSTTTIISDEDGNSDQMIKTGEVYTLEDLWHIALVGSSNKAVNALVRAAGLNREAFVDQMNKRAKELGLKSLRFLEPTGLSDKNTGSAADAVFLLREALRLEKIYNTLRVREHYAQPLNQEKKRLIWSTNWLLTGWTPSEFTAGQVIGKTGYTSEAGYNFVAAVTNPKNNRAIIIALLGAASNEQRFEEVRDLAEWIFDKYVWPEDPEYAELVE